MMPFELVLHALNTSTLGVARLKARFGEHFGYMPLYAFVLRMFQGY